MVFLRIEAYAQRTPSRISLLFSLSYLGTQCASSYMAEDGLATVPPPLPLSLDSTTGEPSATARWTSTMRDRNPAGICSDGQHERIKDNKPRKVALASLAKRVTRLHRTLASRVVPVVSERESFHLHLLSSSERQRPNFSITFYN